MKNDVWELFPFPTIANGHLTNGSLLQTHSDCNTCSLRTCVSDDKALVGELKVCRFGLCYARVDSERFLVGVLATDGVNLNSRAKKRLKIESERRYKSKPIIHAISQARSMGAGITSDFEVLKDEVIKRLEQNPEMHLELAKKLRQDFENNIQQSHDFLQLAKLVKGYAETLLGEKYPTMEPHLAAEKSQTEGAIYFISQLMVLKLDSLVFLQDPQRANERRAVFKIHPMLLKYVRIYDYQATQKELSLRVSGESYARANYNSQAIGAVIQGILDNLVKYAPGGSDAMIKFSENGNDIFIAFTSFGPRIDPEEIKSIFLPGFRAAAAKLNESTGQGIGLATAKQVSDVLGLQLSVEQSDQESSKFQGYFSTTFNIKLKVDS